MVQVERRAAGWRSKPPSGAAALKDCPESGDPASGAVVQVERRVISWRSMSASGPVVPKIALKAGAHWPSRHAPPLEGQDSAPRGRAASAHSGRRQADGTQKRHAPPLEGQDSAPRGRAASAASGRRQADGTYECCATGKVRFGHHTGNVLRVNALLA